MGNLQSLESRSTPGELSHAELERLQRRLNRIGRGRAEMARSDLRSIEGDNPFLERIFQITDTGDLIASR